MKMVIDLDDIEKGKMVVISENLSGNGFDVQKIDITPTRDRKQFIEYIKDEWGKWSKTNEESLGWAIDELKLFFDSLVK